MASAISSLDAIPALVSQPPTQHFLRAQALQKHLQRPHVPPAVIWFTGLSGAGKSTTATQIKQLLDGRDCRCVLLDGDVLRTGLCADLGFSEQDRLENSRRLAEVAKLFLHSGHVVLVSAISPLQAARENARALFATHEFLEVYLNTPLHICEARDAKGLYRKARQGLLSQFTGVTAPYEPPQSPEVSIDTSALSPTEAAREIIRALEALAKL